MATAIHAIRWPPSKEALTVLELPAPVRGARVSLTAIGWPGSAQIGTPTQVPVRRNLL